MARLWNLTTILYLLKVMDNVGNRKIYGSNGIVLENFHDITVTYKEDPAETTAQQGTVSGTPITRGVQKLNLTAKENASESKFYSGLEKSNIQSPDTGEMEKQIMKLKLNVKHNFKGVDLRKMNFRKT